MRFCAIGWVCVAFTAGMARASYQEFRPPVHDPAAKFFADADEEAKRGTYIFYTQEYRDQRKEQVSIRGSVYGVLRDVKLNGCDFEATVQVNDLFSGFIKGRPTGEQQDATEYTVRIRISAEVAAGTTLVEARPAQLAHAMHTHCDGDGSCTFHWLRIQLPEAAMRERIVVNRSVTFDGPVKELLLPVSSREAGEQLRYDLQAVADASCK